MPTEAIIAITCESRAAVDALSDAALTAGGAPFQDLDGHLCEFLWMDPSTQI